MVNPMSEPLARIEGVTKRFGGRAALEPISFEIGRGEILALAGENGAGKSTAIRILLGLVRADAGMIAFGFDRSRRGAIGYLPEESEPFARLSAREILDATVQLTRGPAGDRRTAVNRLIETAGLPSAGDLPARGYSKGMLRRLGIAMALAGDPELLVLDEPQSGLDPSGREDLAAIVLALKRQGRGILIASHDLAEIAVLADRVLLLNHGRIVAERPVAGMTAEALRAWFFAGTGRGAKSEPS